MTAHSWLTVVSSLGQLFLGLLALLRGGRSVLALPLALLCFDFFAFNAADLAYRLDGNFTWKLLDHAASPLGAPLALHVMLAFTGRLRARRVLLGLTYAGMGLLAATAVIAPIVPAAAALQLAPAWSYWHLTGDLIAMSVAGATLVRFLRVETDPGMRQRTRLILAALVVTLPLALTDIFGDVLGYRLPHLSNVGTLAATTLLAVSVLRFRLFGADLSASAVTVAAVLATGVVVTYGLVFGLLVSSNAALVLGTASATFLVGLLGRTAGHAMATRRARATQLALLGRFAAQLTHDLRNPLAAVKGATDFLLEEHHLGRSLDAQVRFIELVRTQVERIEASLLGFERLGRVNLEVAPVAVGELVRSVLALLALRVPAEVTVVAETDEGLPEIAADAELVTRAFENVVRNALEAMPARGVLTVRTARGATARRAITITVEDTGDGMDAAECERALEDFYTTKDGGGGLGLPFVRRVVEAHGGELVLSSRKGHGTRVELTFPDRP